MHQLHTLYNSHIMQCLHSFELVPAKTYTSYKSILLNECDTLQ